MYEVCVIIIWVECQGINQYLVSPLPSLITANYCRGHLAWSVSQCHNLLLAANDSFLLKWKMTGSDDVSLRDSDIGDMGPGHQTGTLHPDTLQSDTAQHYTWIIYTWDIFPEFTTDRKLIQIFRIYLGDSFIRPWVWCACDNGKILGIINSVCRSDLDWTFTS